MKLTKVLGITSLLAFGGQGFAADNVTPAPAPAKTEAAPPAKVETAPAPVAPEVTRVVTARVRTEWLQQTVDTKTTATTTTRNSGFRMPKLDLTFNNKLGTNVTADIRVSPVQAVGSKYGSNYGSYNPQSTTANNQSGTSSAYTRIAPVSNLIEHAWLEYKMGNIALRTGKLDMLEGNVEYMWDSSFDYYMTSYFQSAFISPRQLGASLYYFLGDQKFEFQITNGDPTSETYATSGYSSFAAAGNTTTGLAYHGNLGMVKPLVTFTQVRYALPSEDTNNDGIYTVHNGKGRTIVGVGAQINAGGAHIAAEFDNVSIDQYKNEANGVSTTGGNNEKAHSIIMQVKYPIAAFTPVAKIEIASDKLGATGDVGDISLTGISLAAEYAVAKDARIYGVYNNVAQTMTKGGVTVDKKLSVNEFLWGAAVKI